MKNYSPIRADYRNLRLNNIGSKSFRHILLLLFWPIYGLSFVFVERWYKVEEYYPVESSLDALIPFNEWFVIPYTLWFFYIIVSLAYTFFTDVGAFSRSMWFIIATYSTTIITYLIFPTCQNLRPEQFANDNILTRFMQGYYAYDTNTNVCPSLHVIGSFTSMCAFFDAWRNKKLYFAKAALVVLTLLISVSTVFLKQHSIIDIFAAIPYLAVFFPFCYSAKLQTFLKNRFFPKKASQKSKESSPEKEKELLLH